MLDIDATNVNNTNIYIYICMYIRSYLPVYISIYLRHHKTSKTQCHYLQPSPVFAGALGISENLIKGP